VVRFTLSVCSERLRRALDLILVPLLVGLPVLAPAAEIPQSAWRRGAFPVVSFSGYTSHYGQRIGPGGGHELHRGLDIAAPLGSPIRNWWGGVVREVINDDACGLGLRIASGPYEHLYCHLAGHVQTAVYRSGTVALAAGSRVRAGQLIGHVGLSGRSTGPHLHWALRFRGHWCDPARVLRAMAAAHRRP
jgi:murein DD-endopeptidase MepM/ murein hydrolase activator NlpD